MQLSSLSDMIRSLLHSKCEYLPGKLPKVWKLELFVCVDDTVSQLWVLHLFNASRNSVVCAVVSMCFTVCSRTDHVACARWLMRGVTQFDRQ